MRLDSHLDTLHEFARLNLDDYDLNKNRPELKLDIPRLNKSGVKALFFALFIKQEWGVKRGQERIRLLYSILQNILIYNKNFSLCYSLDDILKTINENKIALNLSLENGMVLGENLKLIKQYYNLGIRYITLCHNFSNQICDSSTDRPIHNGLSKFGRELIKEMNKIGTMIDISHASDKSVNDILDITELPIIASHSNCFSICNNPRNLNDKLIERIAKNGGVVQTTVLPKCVGGNRSVVDFVNHIDYIKSLVGIDYVGFGSDFDGGGGINGCEDIGEINNITDELIKRKYSKEDIGKFWGKNFLRAYQANYH